MRIINKRERLLEAGIFQVSINGIESTRVEDITKQAGVAKGTFYTYFKSKEDMLEQLMDANIERYTGLFTFIREVDLSFEEKVKTYLRARFKKFSEEPKFFYMILSMRKNGELGVLDSIKDKLGKRGDKLIRIFFEENIDKIKEEYRDELGIICPSIMATLFTYQDIISERVKGEVKCEEDYEEIKKRLAKLDFEKYINQFYELNIKGIIKEG